VQVRWWYPAIRWPGQSAAQPAVPDELRRR
jgi:hypothetical protein